MTFGYENIITIGLFIVGFLIAVWAYIKMSTSYNKYNKMNAKIDLSGVEVARKILDANGLINTYVLESKEKPIEHYTANIKVIRLSKVDFDGSSITSISAAAHECGHAIQDKEGYPFLKMRSMLDLLISFITYCGYFILIVSFFSGIIKFVRVGMLLLLTVLLFHLLTLPIELDASKRAQIELKKLGLINNNEVEGVRDMLSACSLTYVASFITVVPNLVKYFMKRMNKD